MCKSEYFRRALDGEFKEAGDQAIDLPEENPDIFSFVVAYLYEERFSPIKTMSTVLSRSVSYAYGILLTHSKLRTSIKEKAEKRIMI